MGANVFSRPQTQRDVARIFSQVRGSPLDSVRRSQTRWNSLTRKRSLVQIQYGPPGKRYKSNEQGLDKALTKAAKVVKRTVEATIDEITSELQEALKS